MKADTKITVVMGCQIVDRKSVAPSSGNRRRGRPVGKNRNFDKNLYSRFAAAAGLTRGDGTQRNFQYLLVFFVGASGAFISTIENLCPTYWFSKYLFFLKILRRLQVN